jgi:ferredoxin-NADP reductase
VDGTAPLGRLTWRVGEVVETRQETHRVRSLAIQVPGWEGHRPGQHVDLRLTAEDGYQAVRSYSLAAPPLDSHVLVTVELIEDGELSPWLVEEAQPGDQLEVRGPVGGYFVWEPPLGGPLLLVAGGSGIVPLAAMLRSHAVAGSEVPVRLLYSARGPDEVLYPSELGRLGSGDGPREVVYTYTRSSPPDWTGYTRRVDASMLSEVAWPPGDRPLAYVCGPTAFVETVANALHKLGHDPERIRTERFGPSGGDE